MSPVEWTLTAPNAREVRAEKRHWCLAQSGPKSRKEIMPSATLGD